MARIAIVGVGYVGLTTGACLAQSGHVVACVDVDHARIEGLRRGVVPIFEPGLTDIVADNQRTGRLTFTTDFGEALADVEFVFIAVGTPMADDGRSADLRFVHSAVRDIGRHLMAPAIVINKSTSPIGTGCAISRILEEENPRLSPWRVVSNPEFLREGCAVFDCLHPARIVLGGTDEPTLEAVAELYADLRCPVIKTDLNSAEMIKYASNAFLATRISFINEVARICDALDADVSTVAQGMGLDPRIGQEFLRAGLGYGGSCFPKDVAALRAMAADAGLHPQLLMAVAEINDDQRRWVVERLERELGGIQGKVVAIFGLSFKPETDDLRGAPALDIASRLSALGAEIRVYDPVVRGRVGGAVVCSSVESTAESADAILLATDWSEFRGVDWNKVRSVMRGRLVFDGRNLLDPEQVEAAGLKYVGVGRGGRRLGSPVGVTP